jgi:glucose-6-phosphate isomerase
MSWSTYQQQLIRYPQFGFTLDTSLMGMEPGGPAELQAPIARAWADMRALEAGEFVNTDENRQVGHYWLRNPDLAPAGLREKITGPLAALKEFAAGVLSGATANPAGEAFAQMLLIGIGGSALGPQLVSDALGHGARLPLFFFDNTDPAGIDAVLADLAKTGLGRTLVLVISKSGGTPETRIGMLEAAAAWQAAGLDFGRHAVAITGVDSQLDRYAVEHGFIKRFPMEDWVGGRTSVLSTVGLVPAALQGIDIDALLAGAAAMDEETRKTDAVNNAAMRLALAWFHAGRGRGEKDMVVLPYKDSLLLFSKYLQQLVMESLGKKLDRKKNEVHQGITVYGNKGSTDQHAYVQQLRDGVDNFFATFIEVRQGRDGGGGTAVRLGTAADYLQGFLRGTRKALCQAGRMSLTLSIEAVTPFTLGLLIALFERAVSFYASLIDVNAYHQPGVEDGKRAATKFLTLLGEVRGVIAATPQTAEDIMALTKDGDPEDIYHCLNHLAANREATVVAGATPAGDRFAKI